MSDPGVGKGVGGYESHRSIRGRGGGGGKKKKLFL